jgi:DNA repair exonuclease SbcCD ATPase subunit
MIATFRNVGIDTTFLQGNHDRIALNDDAVDWFPALEQFGSHVFSSPGSFQRCGTRFYMIPFFRKNEDFRQAVFSASEEANEQKLTTVLCFHQTVQGASLRVGDSIAEGPDDSKVEDLCPGIFTHCIGGHIHKPQVLKSCFGAVHYVGSPICHDWGEVNQQKGYLYLDKKGKLKRINSKLPGWVDPSLEEFPKRKTWKGVDLRLRVPVSGKNSSTELASARAVAESTYPGAVLHVIPEVIADGATALIDPESGQDEAVARYVADTAPPSFPEAKIIKYLQEKIEAAGGSTRNMRGIKFQSAVGENVLSFKSVKADFTKQGITVVSGENLDWDESNGSGKTNFLQLLAIALFGRTRKGQTANGWIRDTEPKAKAYVSLELILPDGREMRILRQRNPAKLEVYVGDDVTTGKGAQHDIETLTGLTWDLLTSVIYLDQSEGNTLVDGTDGERKALIFQVLQLEKYETARRLAKTDLFNAEEKASKALLNKNHSVRSAEEFESLIESSLEDEIDVQAIKSELVTLKKKLRGKTARRGALSQTYAAAKEAAGKLKPKRDAAMTAHASELSKAIAIAEALNAAQALAVTCSKCGQEIPEEYREERVADAQQKLDAVNRKAEKFRLAFRKLEDARKKHHDSAEEAQDALDELREESEDLVRSIAAHDQRVLRGEEQQKRLSELREKLKEAEGNARKWVMVHTKAVKSSVVFRYCVKALSKSGIPAYLTASLCPQLSAAALTYSELFADGAIQVEFVIDERQDLDVQVTNLHGGAGLLAQSRGEASVVSLIVGFALRDVITPANILIADEPGDGLDERRATLFSQGLQEIESRFGALWVTTHNRTILEALTDARHIKIVKEGKVSTICEG